MENSSMFLKSYSHCPMKRKNMFNQFQSIKLILKLLTKTNFIEFNELSYMRIQRTPFEKDFRICSAEV